MLNLIKLEDIFDLMKDFFEQIERKVSRTIVENKLIDKKKDKVVVALSGGKDSTTAAYILKKLGYDVFGLTVDALIGEYSKKNILNVVDFCEEQGIDLKIVSMREEFGYSLCYIRSLLESKGVRIKSCQICGILRRHILNKHALKLKASKIVTGHNLDDEAQSFMMNMFKNELELCARLGPKSGVKKSKGFVQRVKPLYFCLEKEVKRYSKEKGFKVVYEPCPCRSDSYRNHIREELDKLGDRAKISIVDHFYSLLPELKEHYSSLGEVGRCRKCGMPAKGDICRVCKIIGLIKDRG